MTPVLFGLRGLLSKVVVADGEIHYSSRVPEGQRWYIERVGYFNDVTDNSECFVSIETGGMTIPVDEFLDHTVDVWERKEIRLWLFPNERLSFKLSGSTAADPVKFTWLGHRKID